MSNNQPFDTIRVGRIKATVWENENQQGGIFHSVTLARNFRDENNQWQETNTFSVDDMPRVRMASDKAFDSIYERLQQLHYAKRDNSQKEAEEQKEGKNSSPARKTAAKKKSHAQRITDERKEPAAKSR